MAPVVKLDQAGAGGAVRFDADSLLGMLGRALLVGVLLLDIILLFAAIGGQL